MSDQAKWLKLWESALTDAHLENLELDNWARYVRLMLYIKCHGNLGKIRFPEPFRAIKSLFRMEDIDAVCVTLTSFPNCVFKRETRNGETTVTLNIHFTNWYKYQIDSSASRVKAWRKSKRHGVTRLEEKRREESNDERPLPLPRASRSGYADAPPRASREKESDHFCLKCRAAKMYCKCEPQMTREEMDEIKFRNMGPKL